MFGIKKVAGGASALLFTTILSTGVAYAQTSTPDAEEVTDVDADDRVIVVTARKSEERLQDVPLSMEAFSAREIERRGIRDLDSLARNSTSITFDKGANPESATITIRGLSPTRGRSSTAVLIDGIDVTTEAIGSAGGGTLLNSRLLDVERIEIVRGPQSVQYGRSAFAGGIQYITRTPGDELQMSAALDLGNYDRYTARASVSGPVVEGLLSLGIVGSGWAEAGYYREQARLSRIGGGSGYGAALIASLTPAPGLRFKARLEYFDDHYDPQAQYLLRSNLLFSPSNNPALATAFAAGVVTASPFATYQGVIPDGNDLPRPQHSPDPLTDRPFAGSDLRVVRGSLIGNYEAENVTLTSWTGYTDVNYGNRQDFDQDAILSGPVGQQIDTSSRTGIQDSSTYTSQFSQELRLASSFEGPFQFTLGGLYWRESSDRDVRSGTVACAASIPECANGAAGRVPFVSRTPNRNSRTTTHWSVYGGVEWAPLDTFNVSVEGRYSWERERVIGANCGLPANRFGVVCGDPFTNSASTASVFGPGFLLSDGRTTASSFSTPVQIDSDGEFFTPRFTLDWTPSEQFMIYASAAKGVKPGGTSTVGGGAWFDSDLDGDTDELDYGPETLWSYEIGSRQTWAGGAIRTSIAAFYMDYTDKQVVISFQTPSGDKSATIENAGAARVWGLEFEGRWSITRNLGIGLGYTYLNPRYTDFVVTTDTKGNVIDAGNCNPVGPFCEVSFTGNTLEGTSRHSLIGAINFQTPISLSDSLPGTNFFIESNTSYRSRRYIEQGNRAILRGYSLTDLRVGLRTRNWEFLAYVDNLFDDDTIQSANTKTGDVDRVVRNLAVSTRAILVNLPNPRTFGIRFNIRY